MLSTGRQMDNRLSHRTRVAYFVDWRSSLDGWTSQRVSCCRARRRVRSPVDSGAIEGVSTLDDVGYPSWLESRNASSSVDMRRHGH